MCNDICLKICHEPIKSLRNGLREGGWRKAGGSNP